MSGLRVFAPIMPSEWAAVHLSYLKELDLLMSKKAELKRGKDKNQDKDKDKDPTPKGGPKNRFPKKPKAKAAAEAE